LCDPHSSGNGPVVLPETRAGFVRILGAARTASSSLEAGMSSPGPQSNARLSRAQEVELVLAAQARPGPERERLVEVFAPLIGSIARNYAGRRDIERRELKQEGVVGLLRALQRYDPEVGASFWAYASWWVRQAMQQLVSELGLPIVLSDRAMRQLARIRNAERRLAQEHRREPTRRELADATGFSLEHVECLASAARRPRGLEEPVGGEGEQGAVLGDRVADPRAEDDYELVPLHVACGQLPKLLDSLDERERRVVCQRFGLDGPERTLRDLAGDLGVSLERVRQIEQESLHKCRLAAARPG
jgi:RNA polymerase primary sigma factor